MSLSPPAQEFIAGGVSGCAAILVGQPLDTVRIMQQANAGAFSSAPPPSSVLATARGLIARGGGVRALWRGVVYPATTIAGQSALVFQAYGAASRSLAEYCSGETKDGALSSTPTPSTPPPPTPSAPLSLPGTFLAGAAAGAAQVGIIVPVDALKLRAQLSEGGGGRTPVLRRPASALAALLKAGGIRGLYRGAAVTVARDVPSYGLYFGLYEWGQRALGGRAMSVNCNSTSPPTLLSPSTATLLAGGCAGAAAWLAVYPLDVIKTQVQAVERMERVGGRENASSSRHHTFRSAAWAGGLWAGAPATVARAFLINAVLFWTYERVMTGFEE